MTDSLLAWLDRAAQTEHGLRFLDRREREHWLPWSQLRSKSLEASGRLRHAGLEAGDRVALIYPTGPDFFEAFFGALLAGAVPVPLYPPVRLGRLDEYHQRTSGLINAVGARLVLGDSRVLRLLGKTALAARPELGCRRLSDLEAAEGVAIERDPEKIALIQFSSGTTVAPKPVALSERALVAQTLALNSFWPDDQGVGNLERPNALASPVDPKVPILHTGVSWLPLYHDMGLIGCVLPALERPSTLTLIPPELFVAKPAVWLRALSRYRATLSPAPNFAYGLCVEKITDEELEGVDLSHWRVALNGAEAVAPSVLRRFNERFAPYGLSPTALTPVYGLSEAALAVTFSALGQPFEACVFDRQRLAGEGLAKVAEEGVELVSLGKPLPGFDLSIRDFDRQPVAENRVGKVWVSGPSLMSGYFGNPEATPATLVDDWLDTGDLGFLCRGELYLTGRHKDLIIHRGRNFSPELFEQAVDDLAGVRRGCSVAVGEPLSRVDGSEPVLLFVEHHRSATASEIETLAERCRQAARVHTGVELDEIHIVSPGTLPRTSSGKLRRQETLLRFRAEQLTPGDSVNALLVLRSLFGSQRAFRKLKAMENEP